MWVAGMSQWPQATRVLVKRGSATSGAWTTNAWFSDAWYGYLLLELLVFMAAAGHCAGIDRGGAAGADQASHMLVCPELFSHTTMAD